MWTKYVWLDDLAVRYYHSGTSTLPNNRPPLDTGEVIVFVHGAGGNANMWQPAMDALAEKHSVLAFDFPAHGRSGATEGPDSLAGFVGVLSAFVKALDLRPFVLVGKGLGATIALEYAASHVKNVRGLVALSTALQVDLADEIVERWRDVSRGRATQPFTKDEFCPLTLFDVMRKAWTEQVQTDPRVRYTDLVVWRSTDLHDTLGEVRQPVLVVAGADDRIVSPEASQELCPMLPNARMETVAKAGHALELEQPEVLAERIDGFVNSLDRED